MCWAMSEIRASQALGDITSPKPSPCAPATSLWVGVLCFLDVALVSSGLSQLQPVQLVH